MDQLIPIFCLMHFIEWCTVIKKVLILGSGGLSIGQAGEFDYSGSQAIKALKSEGIQTILINPNIATIQTSEWMADTVYFLPVTPEFTEQVIEKERPDGIFLSFGGQTALNCGLQLHQNKVFEKFNILVLGTPIETIQKTEDRKLFVETLKEIAIMTPRSIATYTLEEAKIAAMIIGYPVILRAAYALGGLGSGICKDEQALVSSCKTALTISPQILVEESLEGWKEIEYEVVRDCYNNTIIVCNMENLDPLGIHTGESIVIAPSQTLTNEEYHLLRKISIVTIQHLGIIGECNIQFALNPETGDYRVIEVNARLSRSSALASKVTGYPLAFVAAKLGIGKSLYEITNPITGTTSSFFEPALDYIAVKFPRWDLDKFKTTNHKIGTSMKSVGEVLALGRSFEECIQKAVRMTKQSYQGIIDDDLYDIEQALLFPSPKRIFAISSAFQQGWTVPAVYKITRINPWYLERIKRIVEIDEDLKKWTMQNLTPEYMRTLKQNGFSDRFIAMRILGNDLFESELAVRLTRKSLGVHPVTKQIDTLAAEFPAQTNYLYLTYHGTQNDVDYNSLPVLVLGSGVYSIGSSVEFDWCSVQCVKTLRTLGKKTVVINCNPETVSTDYDESDRLYFEELSFERVMDIIECELPFGVIVSVGGQIPNSMACNLAKMNVPILGTKPSDIDRAENRHTFSALLDNIGIDQPEWKELTTLKEMKLFSSAVGYPVLIRPSYVLSGSSMSVAYNDLDLQDKISRAVIVSREFPVVVSKFILEAQEIEFDAVAHNGEILVYAISEHIEHAGVHSGDATLVTPPQWLWYETVRRMKKIARAIIKELNVTGPVNIQILAKDNALKIIECNLRASRTFPFISKVYHINFIDLATKAMLSQPSKPTVNYDLDYVGVKAPQFSFTRIHGADPVLGVEMCSTGEVACFGEDVYEAYLKALLSTGFSLQLNSILFSTGSIVEKVEFLEVLRELKKKGCILYATAGTAQFYASQGISMETLAWPFEDKQPNVIDYLQRKMIDLVINIPKNNEFSELQNDYSIRRTASDCSIPLLTNLQSAKLFFFALGKKSMKDLHCKSWREYHA